MDNIAASLLFLFLLKYSWHTVLYKFKVYNIVILYLYTLWFDYHDKSSNHLLLSKVIMILLTLFPVP